MSLSLPNAHTTSEANVTTTNSVRLVSSSSSSSADGGSSTLSDRDAVSSSALGIPFAGKNAKFNCRVCMADTRRECANEDVNSSTVLDNVCIKCTKDDCPGPNSYHLSCLGLPKQSQMYRNAIISHCKVIDRRAKCKGRGAERFPATSAALNQVYSSKSAWWHLPGELQSGGKYLGELEVLYRKLKKKDYPIFSFFVCPSCDLHGSKAIMLIDYFERFDAMKIEYFAEQLNWTKKAAARGPRTDRPDECVEIRSGLAFLSFLVDDARNEFIKNHRKEQTQSSESELQFNPTELRLERMSEVLCQLERELPSQTNQEHRRRDKFRKHKITLDPTYLVGLPIRLFNPIDNSYNSGRIIDCKSNSTFHDDAVLINSVTESIDEQIASTLYLVRFARGLDGRKVAIHKWIYLEEHAVIIGGDVCWARVDDAVEPSRGKTSGLDSEQKTISAVSKDYVVPYRPVQLVFRSMLEMIPLQNLNPYSSIVLAYGLGQSVNTMRISIRSGSGGKGEEPKGSGNGNAAERPCVIPLTEKNPAWIDEMLKLAKFSDEDVAMAFAKGLWEREEQRRARAACPCRPIKYIEQSADDDDELLMPDGSPPRKKPRSSPRLV
mmetsp:Transcript_29589/g.70299  ORF Transcript_29589/g.70299 Transcript_29589/m.70299 type:complete len:606 (-) Transcript_29589:124-1941(-)